MNLQRINPVPSRQSGNQFRFACRECGKVKVADERTHGDVGGQAYGGDLRNLLSGGFQQVKAAHWRTAFRRGRRLARLEVLSMR